MTEKQFLSEFSEIVGTRPGELELRTELSTLEAWDSISYLSAMVMIDDKFGVTVDPLTLVNAKTIAEIYDSVQMTLGTAPC